MKSILKKIVPNFILKYYRDFILDRQRRRFGKSGKELLFFVDDILKSENIPYWLNYGTLLGAYRDHAFIPHDYDLDIGLFWEDYEKIIPLMKKNGLKFKNQFRYNGWDKPENIAYRFEWNNAYIDFNFYKFENGRIATYMPVFLEAEQYRVGDRGKVLAEYNSYPFEGIGTLSFLGRDMPVPLNTEEYIIANYGLDYRTPIKDFDYRTVVTDLKEYSFEEKPSFLEIYY